MAIKATRFDAADYLTDKETQQYFLDEALETNDTADIIRALATIARAQNFSKLARDADITRQGLVKALGPDGNPSFDTIVRLVKAMGLKMGGTPPVRRRSKAA